MLTLTPLLSIVVSVFAIVILSVIGALFKSNHESMMGTTKDPKDGKAVAQTIFITVAVYGVSLFSVYALGGGAHLTVLLLGLPGLLRFRSVPQSATESKWVDKSLLMWVQ